MMKKLVIFCLLMRALTATGFSQELASPDGQILFSYAVDAAANNVLTYTVTYKGRPVILKSVLGLNSWFDNVEIEKHTDSSVVHTWAAVYGERSTVKDHYNQKTIVLKRSRPSGERVWVIVRAYNEGIAVRYYFPEDPKYGGGYLTIDEDKSTFSFAPGTECWFAPYAQASYNRMPLKNWPGQSERPLTLKLDNGNYVALAEASLTEHSRTKFYIRPDEENIVRCALYGRVEQLGPYATPWRVIMVADQPGRLLQNNDLLLNLNEPSKIEDASWVKPGKIMRINELTTEGAKKVINFASKHNIEYVHFDTKWYGIETFANSDPRKTYGPALDMEEVARYARSKNVGVWLYVNQRALYNHLDEILPIYQKWGIAGLKFGFVWVGSQFWTTWLHNAVRKCAQHQLMVDIHDEYRPTGVSRTYPNLLTQEGIRGNEEFPDADLNTVLPFTRFIAGAADYTIPYYSRRDLKPHLKNAPDNKVLINTPAHQLALSVIYYSPLQYLYWYDNPEDVGGEPEIAFFDQLKTVWDDSRVLSGEIGSYIAMARKNSDQWFVAAITNNQKRIVEVSFDFLEPGRKYRLTMYSDGDNRVKTRTQVKVTTQLITSKTKLSLHLQPRGGCAMIATLL